MATKAELEQEVEELRAQLADGGTPVETEVIGFDDDLNNKRIEYISELDEFQTEVWEHRFENAQFVRAFAYARRRGNETKACLIYADAHDLDFEASTEPVVKKD